MPRPYLLIVIPLISAAACAPGRPPAGTDVAKPLGRASAYEQMFHLIAKEEVEGWEPNAEELLRLAADSTVRHHQPVGDYDLVLSIEAQYYGDNDLCGIRGAHNGGSFYVFGRRGDRYDHIGTLFGDRISTGTWNGVLVFTTYSHWSCSTYQHQEYEWKRGRFRLSEDKLLEGGKDGEVVLKDFMRVENRDIDGLIADLKKDDANVRRAAVNALGDIDDRRTLTAIISALEDESALVRRSAARALWSRSSKRALPALLKAANDPDKRVRIGVIHALSKVDDARVLPALTAALQRDKETEVRRMAAIAMRRVGANDACQVLMGALQDVNYEVRIAATESLGALKNKKSVPALLKVLGTDDSQHARYAAAGALAGFKDRQVVDALVQALSDKSPSVRMSVGESLGKIGDRTALPAVIRLLTDTHEYARVGAIRGVTGIQGKGAMPALIKALTDKSHLVRGNAAQLLGEVGDNSVLPALRGLAKDKKDYVRSCARSAIAEIERRRAAK